MRVFSLGRLREFWEDPKNANAEHALRGWYQAARKAKWQSFSDVRAAFGSADLVGDKVVFDIGGNKYRLIAFIDYLLGRVFIRFVLNHKDYDKGAWKYDTFGERIKKRRASPRQQAKSREQRKPKPKE